MEENRLVKDDGWIGPLMFLLLVIVIAGSHVAAHFHGYYRGRVAAQAEMRNNRITELPNDRMFGAVERGAK